MIHRLYEQTCLSTTKITIGGKVDIQGKVKPTLLPVPGL